jgi:hypothetical protein
MNNTKKTRTRTLAIVAVLTAATLVVGLTFAAPTITTQSAFASSKGQDYSKNGNNGNNGNSNTVTIQKDKQQQDKKYVMKGGDKEAKFMKMKRGDKEDTTYKKGSPPPPPQRDNGKTRDNNKDDGGSGGNGNSNTVTIQVNKQKASQSGWDNTQEQEGQNTICTHPESDASCVSESSETPVVTNNTSSDDGEDSGHGHG